ncbi:MAG: choice-of-anchor B family protein [Saprospiraceae bacterium]|nr:choice-of-anchor B family protein [Saprospiraceae bacterium]MCF8249285.1 choice-of-anchor B family protein [Saprospiraceae bacterium]MCF8279706.1 choice-of-anchor B family protein [Bacteroidales bacterium]MCF8311438.1 choice-of-anchor B family protein [Saprospiraceae bacterium]MCF8439904.1 choice-of-anchor B family protein [Saprospiraceae bacterium]
MLLKNTCISIITFISSLAIGQNALNVELLGQVNRGDVRYSGSWAYIAPDDTEYALIGAKSGTAAYCISDNCTVDELGFVLGPVTNWREITVIGSYAFVVTDVQGTGHGMQVIDLSFLPDSLHLVTNYTSTFTTGHIIQKAIDSDEPFVYVMGTSTTQGVHILEISDPETPVEVGIYAPGYYIHDAHVRGNLMFAAAFYDTKIDIVDISDKTNPVLVGTITYDGKNTHSSSTSEDGRFLIVADEQDGYPARVFNIEDVTNAYEVAQYTANAASLVHNPYVKGDFCFVSHNTEGMRVLDIADPTVPVEVGFYDTWTGQSGGFNGLWSACPYFPSGKIIGGNRTDGLYVWSFNNTKAARIYGIVIDSLTGAPLFNATVEILELQDTLDSGLTGYFKKGMLEGDYTLVIGKENYLPKTNEISLSQSDSVFFEVKLVPENYSNTLIAKPAPQKVSVFPNPSNGQFILDLTSIENAEKLKIYAESGELIYENKILGGQLVSLNLENKNGGFMQIAIYDHEATLIATARYSTF